MTSRAVICVANGNWYPLGAERQKRSLLTVGGMTDDEIMQWVNSYPPDSPPHQVVPYGFKPYAFAAAMDAGRELVLWMDASCYALANLAPVWEQIERDGYLLFLNGWTVGEWTTDASLVGMGLTREEALTIPNVVGGCIGLDLRRDVGKRFVEQWIGYASDGLTFPGPHKNDHGQCSADKRVLGHRHDQSAAGVIAHRLGMKRTEMPKLLAYGCSGAGPETVIITQGM